jgi:hypothetical protein
MARRPTSGGDDVKRAVVVIRQPPHPELDREDGFEREWVHESEVTMDAFGVWLEWTDPPAKTLIPWSSVVRVDYEPCSCLDCRPSVGQLGEAA